MIKRRINCFSKAGVQVPTTDHGKDSATTGHREFGSAVDFARYLLGAILRNHRMSLALTVEEVSRQLLVSPTKISRIETGSRSPYVRDVADLAELYRVGNEERDALMRIAHYCRLAPARRDLYEHGEPAIYVKAVQLSTDIRTYHSSDIPSLLCSERYANLRNREYAQIWKTLYSTLTRGSPPELIGIIAESALHDYRLRRCDLSLQLEQLYHLLELARLPNVTVKILPTSASSRHIDIVGEATQCLISETTLPGASSLAWLTWQSLSNEIPLLNLERPEFSNMFAANDNVLSRHESFKLIQEVVWALTRT